MSDHPSEKKEPANVPELTRPADGGSDGTASSTAAVTFEPAPPQIPDHELIRSIGRGAYGEVWLARNALGTYRAIKIVRRQSFENDRPYEREFVGIQKFEPLSRTHESVVDILHVGRNNADGYFYYVMELADDQTTGSTIDPERYRPKSLRLAISQQGRLTLQECIQVSLALTQGLRHMHERGLVHRDIKPANIIFVHGVPKLADIGLVCDSAAPPSYVGTEGYIPPEGPGTPAADIFSLGKVFYEMCTGKDRQQFPDLPTELRDHPDRKALVELNEILLKACANDPARRYRSAQEMENELALLALGKSVKRTRAVSRRWAVARVAGLAAAVIALTIGSWLWPRGRGAGVPPGEGAQVVAVLPFVNENLSAEDDWLCEGITDSTAGAIARIPGLSLAPRRPSFSARTTNTAWQQLGDPPNLRARLEGTVRRQGHILHITSQLISAADGKTLMFQSFDVDEAELHTVYGQVAQRVAKQLQVPMAEETVQRVARRPSANRNADQLYIQARVYWNHRSEGKLLKAQQYFQKAIAEDDTFAQAYSGLADAYSSLVFTYDAGSVSPTNGMAKAEAAAHQALGLDPELPECLTSQAFVDLIYKWNWAKAEHGFTNALARNPNNAHAHHWYSHYLMAMGRTNESLRESSLAVELEPADFIINIHKGWHYLFTRDFTNALKQFEHTRAMYDDYPMAYRYLGLAHEKLGEFDQSIQDFKRANELSVSNSVFLAGLGHAYAAAGRRDEAIQVLENLRALAKTKYVSPYFIAVVQAGLANPEAALTSLEDAYRDRCDALIYLRQDPWLDELRTLAGFAALVEKVGLPR